MSNQDYISTLGYLKYKQDLIDPERQVGALGMPHFAIQSDSWSQK